MAGDEDWGERGACRQSGGDGRRGGGPRGQSGDPCFRKVCCEVCVRARTHNGGREGGAKGGGIHGTRCGCRLTGRVERGVRR
jgi:hypothetical protein